MQCQLGRGQENFQLAEQYPWDSSALWVAVTKQYLKTINSFTDQLAHQMSVHECYNADLEQLDQWVDSIETFIAQFPVGHCCWKFPNLDTVRQWSQ